MMIYLSFLLSSSFLVISVLGESYIKGPREKEEEFCTPTGFSPKAKFLLGHKRQFENCIKEKSPKSGIDKRIENCFKYTPEGGKEEKSDGKSCRKNLETLYKWIDCLKSPKILALEPFQQCLHYSVVQITAQMENRTFEKV